MPTYCVCVCVCVCVFVGGLPLGQDHCCLAAEGDHGEPKVLCEKCWLPICKDCKEHLIMGKLPPLSYANDMWTGYGLERIYRQQVTAMELACASPCLTSMILLSMEGRFRREATVFDEKAHMARHRYGARGNVITFPLPVEDLLQKLITAHVTEHAEEEEDQSVPRSGEQLADVFRVILKTNKQGKTTEEEVKTLIHQATVRRQARKGLATEARNINKQTNKQTNQKWVLRLFFTL